MTEFLTAIDIANRALQHCGSTRIDPAQGFTENSRNAAETAFAYGKLRRAELRRNVWRFATRRAAIRPITATTMLLAATLWMPSTVFFVGSITADADGNLWISRIPNNIGSDPQNSPVAWEPYFGPLTVSLFDATTGYFSGELVYTAPGDGTNRVYLSLQNNNTDVPGTATTYDATVTYFKNQVVFFNSQSYMSLIDLSIGNTPTAAPGLWDASASYLVGNIVGASDGVIYEAITSNFNVDPVTDGGVHWLNTGVLNPWTTEFVGGVGSDKWLLVGGAEFPSGVTLTSPNIVYPIGAGPGTQSDARNFYRLPSGYLREAPQNPKAGIVTWLGGPSGLTYNDWAFEGDFLVSSDFGPILFRFVADITDVSRMDDMFCEGLAARVALEVCEPLTQSSSKLGTIAKIYDEWMSTARTVNGIETGADEPPEDDFIAVRW